MKKYPIEFIKTLPGQIQIIRDFVPEPKPNFDNKNEDVFQFIIWNLYERVYEGIKSFIILFDNKRFYESYIIIGHALETCAILSYIKDNETKQKENCNKYIATNIIGMLIEDLKTNKNLEKDSAWNAYTGWLRLFASHGFTIIKDKKNHAVIFEKLKIREGMNSEKIKLLERNYDPPHIEEYIHLFSAKLDGVDEEKFIRFYLKYCGLKHSNILDCLEGKIPDYQIEDLIIIACMIITYLSISKLEPYQHPVGI